MSHITLASASLLAACLAAPAVAQTGGGSATDPARPALVGAPRPAPGAGARRSRPDPKPAAEVQPSPKPTAAERAEKRKLDHDLKICIGC